MSTEQKLGGFEERLLGELRREVVARAEPGIATQRRGWRARRRLPLAVALGLVAVGAAATLLGGGASAAYAVTRNPDGTVTVEIDNLSDAPGLQQKLQAAGVPAVVKYVPQGKTCAQPWFTPWPGSPHPESSAIRRNSDRTIFTVDVASLPANVTLVITTQALAPPPEDSGAFTGSAVWVAYAQGAVGPCQIVDDASK